MGIVADLVKWPKKYIYTCIVLSTEYSIWSLSSNSPVISEKKMFRYEMSGLGWKVSLTFGAY